MIIEFENEEDVDMFLSRYASYSGILRTFLIEFIKQKPKEYRPFANAKEFEPFIEKWYRNMRIVSFNNNGFFCWNNEFYRYVDIYNDTFSDGTPCGVLK